MQKLEECAESQDPRFNYLYHLIIERIRKFYHKYLERESNYTLSCSPEVGFTTLLNSNR